MAAAKILALLAVLCILALYSRRVGSPRRLALVVALVGLIGAATNVLGIIDAGSAARAIAFGL